MEKKGKLFVISGPSGAGKSTVIGKMMENRHDVSFSVSVTTRAPRPGEQDGVDYYFVTKEKYEELVEQGELLEHAYFAGNGYGTPRTPVLEKLAAGTHVILDIEVQGAAQVKAAMNEAVTIFLMPPSLEVLESRLRGRGTETEEVILDSLARAREELTFLPNYDYVLVNDELENCTDDFIAILTAEHMKRERMRSFTDTFFEI